MFEFSKDLCKFTYFCKNCLFQVSTHVVLHECPVCYNKKKLFILKESSICKNIENVRLVRNKDVINLHLEVLKHMISSFESNPHFNTLYTYKSAVLNQNTLNIFKDILINCVNLQYKNWIIYTGEEFELFPFDNDCFLTCQTTYKALLAVDPNELFGIIEEKNEYGDNFVQ